MRHVISQFADLNPPPALSGRLTSVQGVIGFVRTWYCCGAVDVARLLSIRTQETCSPDNRVSARIAALTTEKRPIELDVDVFVCVDKFTEISESNRLDKLGLERRAKLLHIRYMRRLAQAASPLHVSHGRR